MKERPMIFSAESVRAILDGRKTQTRRVAPHFPDGVRPEAVMWNPYNKVIQCHHSGIIVKCPYGQPGDLLWVRETWMKYRGRLIYRADRGVVMDEGYAADGTSHGSIQPWRSPIHMPRWASRLTLEVVSVRVERVQDISEADAIAEGIVPIKTKGVLGQIKTMYEVPGLLGTYADGQIDTRVCHSAVEGYSELWDHLNEKRGYPWRSNPWVWVIEFRMVEQP